MPIENFTDNNSDVLEPVENPQGLIGRAIALMFKTIHSPVKLFRDIIRPIQLRNQKKFYHRRYNRVPTIDECYDNDMVCRYEAKEQLHRDMKVDMRIQTLLQGKKDACNLYYGGEKKCHYITEMIDEAATNFLIKYGDLEADMEPREVLMKQKHRIAWERRHGKIGTGMKREHPLTFEFDPIPFDHNISKRNANFDMMK
ncbi:NADH dehydrogenase [ubiquinone] 1 beta subcomplex subunit 10 [Intoshia linei]|uniref:NADH dehydrogenase [ubiquinone] 1 beta subcomplex subunit 10 n=1 Tax=Intoshia linei TaxID=1819745 RepID=A0A177BE25_9BILA|nr:NADH dehydrogenase [ubiquinone] 1 beta subcomplex subunit 10 [Intoshia linei]